MSIMHHASLAQPSRSAVASLPSLGPWSCSQHAPGSFTHPGQLLAASDAWIACSVPTTVAGALKSAGRWNDDAPVDIDAYDWWFRCEFEMPDAVAGHACMLCCDGLATLAEIWLNGQPLSATDNMFRQYRIDASAHRKGQNELAIRFRSLTEALKAKRPRPRWKTNLVAQQQLRWMRTSLLGRIPGWSPVAPIVGPWRAIRFESNEVPYDIHLASRLEGSTGIVAVSAHLSAGAAIRHATLRVGDCERSLAIELRHDKFLVVGEVRVCDAPLWWPHTHGEPRLVDCELVLEFAERVHRQPLPSVGFRTIERSAGDAFGLSINGQPLFCRGACWTTSELLASGRDLGALEHDLRLARDAGANMLRVGGTMTYESDDFYRLCDELGIMVWQDFMFANMDYPVDDPAFRANIEAEAREQLRRLSAHPSVVVYCGNSEVEQQAAMLGMPSECWRNEWFGERLPALCAERHTAVEYVPSTPTGGTLPFHTRTGLTHYYGVGAYRRPLGDVRRAAVKFTPECLGFSNIPEPATIDQLTGGARPATHDPRWKQRVPRDSGAGWDFEDIRDHYLRDRFGVDPIALRSSDMPRYLALGRLATGEMMAEVFSEWRSSESCTRGALVWFYKDLWPGAGWGIVDSNGLPKAAWYYLKRSWNSQQLTITDEGLDGLDLHLTNESDGARQGTIEVALLKEPHTVVARQSVDVVAEPHSRQCISADAILGRFYDSAYAYRFGPAHHDVAIATWYDDAQQVVGEAFHFVQRRVPADLPNVRLEASSEKLDDSRYRVTLRSDSFLHAVRLAAKGYLPDDNYFHLPPQRTKTIVFRRVPGAATVFAPSLEALNFTAGTMIPVPAENV
ncbi:MAG TPA: glycoside hydrolase family 2 protein [Pirellulales bacterium]|nr:glycoside hydrolase family 2 protein [Pirellulales bacterium]